MGKKKGGKGKKASKVEEDPHDDVFDGAGVGLGGEGEFEEDSAVIGMTSKKSAKKKAKKAAAAFDFEEDDEDDGAPAGDFGSAGQGKGFGALADLDDGDDEELDDGAPAVDFRANEAGSGFAGLAVDDEDDGESSDDDDTAIVDFGVKNGRPQTQGGGAGFAGLTIDDDEDDEDSDDDQAPVVDFGVKKGAGFAGLQVADESDDSEDDAPIIPGAIAAKAKATAPVKRTVKPGVDAPAVPAETANKKKNKDAGKKPAAANSSGTTEDAEMNDVSRARGKAAIEAQKRKDDKKQKEEDIDAILAELEAAPKPTASKSKKEKKKKKKAKEEEEIEALLAEIEGAKEAVTTSTSVYDSKPESSAAVADADAEVAAAPSVPKDVVAEETKDVQADAAQSARLGEGQDSEQEEVKLSAAQRKKLKKKERAKAKKVEAAEESTAAPGKKGNKESAAVKRMKEAVEKQRMEQERVEKEAAEKQRDLEEQLRREEEEAQAKELKRQEQREKQRLKKEELKKQGLLLSKKELERKKKADQYREQLIASGMIPAAAASETSTDGKKKKVVYDNKKRRQQKQSSKSKVAGTMAESATKEITNKEPTPQASRAVKMATQDAPPIIDPPKKATEQSDPVAETWEDAMETAEPVAATWEDSLEAEESSKQQSQINDETAESKDAHVNGSEAHLAEVEPKSEEEEQKVEDDEEEGNEEDDDDYSDSDEEYSDSDDDDPAARKRRADANKKLLVAKKRRLQRQRELLAKRDPEKLRSPIICILGHVDTGKTKILDKIRRTNVQNGEAGGITQQIGATFFPMEAVRKEVSKVKEVKMQYKLPALLIIDTPGHESFTNLRSRGSGLCDLAILVVDIMHGLEPQTLESIQLLRQRKTPFIVALNKVDRMYGWVPCPNTPTRDSLKKQPDFVVDEFHRRLDDTKVLFAEQGFNAALYWENPDPRSYISFVPTSAISGEGIPDLLMMLVNLSQNLLKERLIYSDVLECTVLEVKVVEGFGTTIDVVLTGGKLKEGDTIVVCGLDAPIVTTVRALLTPHPMRELRVKGQYLHHKEIFAAQGVKIAGEGLEKSVAGTQLLVAEEGTPDEIEFLKEEVMKDFSGILRSVDRSGVGVYVQASTLGSLEALLEFLRTSNIPVSGINIGPVYRKDVVRCSTMLEKKREYACIMAFDVKVESDARDYAQEAGVRIFTADIIYHLFDQFTSYMEGIKKSRREAASVDVVFPCRLKIFPHFVFNKKDPIVVGVEVLEGFLKNNTPLVAKVKDDEWIDIGAVQSIELNKKAVNTAHKGESVAIKIQSPGTANVMYGRHFDHTNEIVSKMSRHSIDLLREHFRDDLAREDWICVIKLKKMLKIE